MKNVAMIKDYNAIVPGAQIMVNMNPKADEADYATLGYLISQANIVMAKNKAGIL